MNEIEKNEIGMEQDCETQEISVNESTETSGNGNLAKVALGVLAVAVGAAGVVAYKMRDKIEERQIKNLKKKGFVIYKKKDSNDVEDDGSEDDAE